MVTAVNGVSIQVIHTDAEGRMVLADTLALAGGTQPALILDYATLTGACVTALGERMSGIFVQPPTLVPAALAAGEASGERVWNFPLDVDYDAELESRIAMSCNARPTARQTTFSPPAFCRASCRPPPPGFTWTSPPRFAAVPGPYQY
ncbi:MAG: hypothetical protein WDM77_13625 [Steroidobacteraceae bacterium]